ncbi:MAG TPA: hypothetical protein DD979_03785 [Gammaproteobacteria bacterium]|nr:hypothetical protein [Gammaproteobacteria bacterium]
MDGPIVNRLPDIASVVAQEIAPPQYAGKQPLRATITRNEQATSRQHSPRSASSRGPRASDQLTVAELLTGESANDMDLLYYVRTVQNTDHRGIWGIIVDGLTDNFARGIAIRRNEQLDTYAVTIPDSADQMHQDASSSFLGRLVYSKSRDSYVYNFRENTMGRDPDLIFPGQELVIIDFEPRELIAIYSHFVASSSAQN